MTLRSVAVVSMSVAVFLTGCTSGASADLAEDGQRIVDAPATAPVSSDDVASEDVASAPSAVATTSPSGSESATTTASVGSDEVGCDPETARRFTHGYTDLDQIEFINPTIVTSGNWLKNRQYHKVVTDANNHAPLVPVYAPMDATAVGITHYLGKMQPWDGDVFELAQFDIRFEAACGIRFWFDHVSELVEPFASLAGAEPVRDTRDAQVPIRVEVKAGDLIGHTSGTEPAHTWDFIVVNRTRTNQFANQERYERSGDLDSLLHADCPFDYFDEPLRSQYLAVVGSWQGRVDGFGCDLEPDVLGTMAGGWFAAPFDASVEFASVEWGFVAKLAADGAVDVNGRSANVRTPSDAPTFADPKTVTSEHCFEDYNTPTRHAYVKLVSDEELAVAFGEGRCPTEMPAAYDTYYR